MTQSCFLNINKPAGITSRDVVNAVSKIVGTKRVGHAGTLDPLATGVLVLAIEKATRLVEYVQQQPKEYVAEFRLGATSTTDDREGDISENPTTTLPDREAVIEALQSFVGTIEQVPPAFSAVKVDGKRAYALARKGDEVELKPRPVEIHAIELLDYNFPKLKLVIRCGSGTYIRSIARDLGATLGVGGLMTALERTAIGCFRIENAVMLETLQNGWQPFARPLSDALMGLPRIDVGATEREDFLHGRVFRIRDALKDSNEVAIFASNEFLGIGSFRAQSQTVKATKGGFAIP